MATKMFSWIFWENMDYFFPSIVTNLFPVSLGEWEGEGGCCKSIYCYYNVTTDIIIDHCTVTSESGYCSFVVNLHNSQLKLGISYKISD